MRSYDLSEYIPCQMPPVFLDTDVIDIGNAPPTMFVTHRKSRNFGDRNPAKYGKVDHIIW